VEAKLINLLDAFPPHGSTLNPGREQDWRLRGGIFSNRHPNAGFLVTLQRLNLQPYRARDECQKTCGRVAEL